MELKKLDLKSCRSWLAVLLAAAMLVTMPGTSALAETADREMPYNPVHYCTEENGSTDITDWSYVYFGSYPQTEIAGSALTAKITGASYDGNGDAWVDGVKYRRISKRDANNDYYFGDSTYRYFKWEKIKWRVLDNNGSTLFVMADKGLDCKDYNEEVTYMSWENCTIRNWLNNDFYRTAFDGGEQGAIVEQTVVNEESPWSWGNTEKGNDTRDKVFLLSCGEAVSSRYGFCENYDTDSVARGVKASDYAYAMGASKLDIDIYRGNSWWWLRSPGADAFNAAEVNGHGYVSRGGYAVNDVSGACVPALHIDLSSDLWTLAEKDEDMETVLLRLLYREDGEWTNYAGYFVERGGEMKEMLPDYLQDGIYLRYAQYYTDETLSTPFDRNQVISKDTTVYVVLGERYVTPQNGTEVKPDTDKGHEQAASITLSSKSVTVPKGKSVAVTATIAPAGTAVTWSTSDASIVEVKDGTITGKKGGKAIITAQANGVKAECEVTVAEVSLNVKSTVLQTGTSSSALQIKRKKADTEKRKERKADCNKESDYGIRETHLGFFK